MNRNKIRRYPPIVVSLAATAIFMAVAVHTILSSGTAETLAITADRETAAGALQTLPAELETVAPTEQPTAEPETVQYESLVMSRDWDAEDGERLLKIAMAEAEGESVEGKALVMLVVLNRVWSEDFPDTIEEVIFQPRQFTPTAEGGRYYTTEPNEECYEALELVESGWDESRGALYFESCKESSWHSRNLEFLFQLGNHQFYR